VDLRKVSCGAPNLGGSEESFCRSSLNWVDRKKLAAMVMRLLVDRENFVVFLYLWSVVANGAHEVLGRLHAWSAIAPNNLAIQ